MNQAQQWPFVARLPSSVCHYCMHANAAVLQVAVAVVTGAAMYLQHRAHSGADYAGGSSGGPLSAAIEWFKSKLPGDHHVTESRVAAVDTLALPFDVLVRCVQGRVARMSTSSRYPGAMKTLA